MMRQMQTQWRYFLTAVMFFTRVPVHFEQFEASDLNRATRFFPLVGILVGAIAALAFWIFQFVFPSEIAVILSMVTSILLTGAFHEDGLADAIDGLGGGWECEQVLAIMVDSRIGSYGAVGLVMVLLAKFQALIHLDVWLIPIVLVAGHALSRWCAVVVMATQHYVKAEGKSKPLATQLSWLELAIATFFGLVPLLFVGVAGLLALLPVFFVWVWFSLKIKRRIGGYTGDCLGAMQQLSEVTCYIGLLASLSVLVRFV